MRKSGTKVDAVTLHAQASAAFNKNWKTLIGRLEMVPGKEVLAAFRTVVSNKYGVSLSDSKIIAAMREDDVPVDFRELLEKLDQFRKAPVRPN